jgi:hypothetical protein
VRVAFCARRFALGASAGLLSLAELISAGGFVQLFVHNGCVVHARSRTCFDPVALRARAAVLSLAFTRLRRRHVADAALRNLVCRGYGTSRP